MRRMRRMRRPHPSLLATLTACSIPAVMPDRFPNRLGSTSEVDFFRSSLCMGRVQRPDCWRGGKASPENSQTRFFKIVVPGRSGGALRPSCDARPRPMRLGYRSDRWLPLVVDFKNASTPTASHVEKWAIGGRVCPGRLRIDCLVPSTCPGVAV